MNFIDTDIEIEQVEPSAISGFDGKIPDKVHLIFALGTRMSYFEFPNNRQEFMSGHPNTISVIDVEHWRDTLHCVLQLNMIICINILHLLS